MHASTSTTIELSDAIEREARQLGFGSVGFCPAVEPTGFHRFQEWLERGYAGTMDYLPDRAAAYAHPRHVLDGARSLVMLTVDYKTSAPTTPPAGHGRVSRYAWGSGDYHDLIHGWLKQLVNKIKQLSPGCLARGVIDTAPLLERDFAQLAGLGWGGKNTLLLNRKHGSLFFLAAIVTDVELAYDLHRETDHCGTCTACLDACPTDAFPQPYVLDATKCISYLTIELRDEVPVDLRPGIGNWLFGCDVCQDVCPWNTRVEPTSQPEFQPSAAHNPMDLLELLQLDDDAFRARFRRTPMWRTKRRGLLRNAAIVLGNQQFVPAIPALCDALHQDQEALVRASCAWALGQIQTDEARHALSRQISSETNPEVIEACQLALNQFEAD
jgi:epoxyqueuosine reductase